MSAILRDRINDLLLANSDLEKEVVRLRYSPQEIIFQENPESELELMETKEVLNSMAHENDQLKLAIVKERYGPRQVPIEAKQKLNNLQIENDELKSEVRKFRYGLHDIFSGYDTPDLPSELVQLEFDDDEGYNSTTEEFYDENFEEISVENEPNFITLTKLQPVLPPVILMGGKVREDSEGTY